jgi:hypothetical protein
VNARFHQATIFFGTFLLSLAQVQSEAGSASLPQSTGQAEGNAFVTEVCLDQDKPPSLQETHYFQQAGDSNVVRIVVAFPDSIETGTNDQNVPFTNVTMPPGYRGTTGYVSLPKGQGIVLAADIHRKPAIPGNARLISVEKLTPSGTLRSVPRSAPPTITINEPVEMLTSRPMIQLKGTSDKPLRSIRFDVVNREGKLLEQQGFVTDSYFDVIQWRTTTNYFECSDIDLAPGTNRVILRCEDFDRHLVTTELTYDLSYDHDKTPPAIRLQWPTPGRQISGREFTARGILDDFTARISARISADGRTVATEGFLERNGRFWIEHIPLLGKTNSLTLTATDAAGNSATTNWTVIRSDSILTIDPVPRAELWQLQVTVTGNVFPPDQDVWVNGRRARVKPNGNWIATGIRMTKEGVAIFEGTAVPRGTVVSFVPANVAGSPYEVLPQESLSLQSDLSKSGIVLNATQPTYGVFNLHLTGVAGKSFVLSASTNLLDWTPVLTNRNSATTFDYADTNVLAYGCRFFRVVPVE